MGNIESGELTDFWDNTIDPAIAGIDEEAYARDYYRYETSPERINNGGYTPDRDDSSIPRTTAPPSPAPAYARSSVEASTPPRVSVVKSVNASEGALDAPNDVIKEHKTQAQEKDVPQEPSAESQAQTKAEAEPSPPPATSENEVPKASTNVTAENKTSTGEDNQATTATAEVVEAAAAVAAENASLDVNINRSQASNLPSDAATIQPDGGGTVKVRSYRDGRFRIKVHDKPFAVLFICHFLLVTMAIIYLVIVFFKGWNDRKLHNLTRWFPKLCAAIATGAILGAVFQTLFRRYAIIMSRVIIGTSAVLTAGVGIMLISTSLAANLGVGILLFIISICEGLYASWVTSRIKFAGDIMSHAFEATKRTPGTFRISYVVLLGASVWLVIWSIGVVSALTFPFAALVVLGLIVSLAWTMETLRNIVCTSTGKNIYDVYVGHVNSHWHHPLASSLKSQFGSICLGSFIVPTLHVLRVAARGLHRVHGDNEFMFSCADCFYKVTYSFSKYANNWAYVEVGVTKKPFCQASKDTFNLFHTSSLDLVIERDLTNSFCVLSGISGGMLCAILCGGWTFGTHKALTLPISVVSFLIGYFLVRIMMAVPHGAVSAHYVCYAQDPNNAEVSGGPIPSCLDELKKLDTEAGKMS